MRLPVYRTALGIGLWDIVHTSYGSGPYEVVNLSPPRYVTNDMSYLSIRRLPTISIIGGLPPTHPNYADKGEIGFRIINDVRLQDGRYITDTNDEVFVEKRHDLPSHQLDMFETYLQSDTPYPEQPGVNYDAGDGYVWHCPACLRDSNTTDRIRRSPLARCPVCNSLALKPIFTHRYPSVDVRVTNDFLLSLRY